MKRISIHESWFTGEFQTHLTRQTLILVGIATFFAVSRPFNTIAYLPTLGRGVYWFIVLALVWITHSVIRQSLEQRFPNWTNWLLIPSLTLASAPIAYLFVHAVQSLLLMPIAAEDRLSVFGYTAFVCAAIAMLQLAYRKEAFIPKADELANEPRIDPRLKERLPLELREAEIMALEASDHYVNVITTNGDALIHMRLRDAIACMPTKSGTQVHRSWWVASDHCQSPVKREGRMFLLLGAERQVPVSRQGQKTLDELEP